MNAVILLMYLSGPIILGFGLSVLDGRGDGSIIAVVVIICYATIIAYLF